MEKDSTSWSAVSFFFAMDRIFRLPGASADEPSVTAWFEPGVTDLRHLTRFWFDRMCASGPGIRTILHDGQPTACLGEAAFGYVDAFRAHANIGFFHGNALDDPARLLRGTGRYMRHVRLRPGEPIDTKALETLIQAAYCDIASRLAVTS
jgi:hypothetical protein